MRGRVSRESIEKTKSKAARLIPVSSQIHWACAGNAGEAADGLELLQLLQKTSPHLVILDLSMPNIGGMAVVEEMRRNHPQVKVLILSMHKTRAHFCRAISMQVQGYLLKEDAGAELLSAIKVIRQGGVYVSPLLSGKSPLGR